MSRSVEHELLQHTAALRRLATHLVGEQHADDLVQDTALQALQKPPQRPHQFGGWLAGIARHLALHHHRRERRRRTRERSQARPETLPPDTSADDRDTLRRLSEAMLALPEPYASVLLRRYLRELSPTQIAEQSGVPLATVKSQLQRGLQLLRERLEQHGGDWRMGLCLAFGIGRALPLAGTAITTSGVLLMGTRIKLAIAAAVVLAAGTTYWCARADAPVVPRSQDSGPTAAAVAAAGAAEPVAPPGEAASLPQRTELPLAGAPVLATLRGRCVDANALPLAGVSIDLHGGPPTLRSDLVLVDAQGPKSLDAQVQSRADGTFMLSFAPPPEFGFTLRLQAAGRADATARFDAVAAAARIDVGDVVLLPAVTVRGAVFEESGAPVTQTSIHLQRADLDAGEVKPGRDWSVTTRDDGSFTFGAALASGHWSVEVQNCTVVEEAQFLLAAPVSELRLVVRNLDPTASITGVVLDAAGSPLANVRISSPQVETVSTGRDGRFRLLRSADSHEPVPLLFDKQGYEVLKPTTAVAWGSRDLRFVLDAATGQIVHVVRADDGTAVENFDLYVLRERQAGRTEGPERTQVISGKHETGRVPLQLQSGNYRLLVAPADAGLATSDLVPFAVTAGGGASVVVRLPDRSERLLRLQRRDGTLVADARAQLCLPPVSDKVSGLPPAPLASWYRGTWENLSLQLFDGRTDAAGELQLSGAPSISYALQLPGPGHAPMQLTDVRLDQDGALVITVDEGATLRGRCTPVEALADLRALAQPGGAASRDERSAPPLALQLRRSGSAMTYPAPRDPPVEIGDDGSFEYRHAPAGEWLVQLPVTRRLSSGSMTSPEQVGTVTLRDGETTQFDIDLSDYRTGRLDAQVLHNGEPLADLFVWPLPVTDGGLGHGAATVRTDAEGRFSCVRFHGTYRVEWSPAKDPWGDRLRAEETTVVLPGQTATRVFHLRSGTLRVLLVDANGAPAPGMAIELVDAAGERRCTLPLSDKSGRAEALVNAESFTLRTLPASLQAKAGELSRQHLTDPDPLAASLLGLGSVTVKQGTATEVTLRLPADEHR